MLPRSRALTRFLLSLATVLLLVNARGRAVQHPSPLADPPADAFSYSEPWKAAVRHVELDLTVDFDRRRLTGSATLHVDNFTGAPVLVLDSEDLTIHAVTVDGVPGGFTVDPPAAWGSPIRVSIGRATRRVTIEYTTGPNASGLHWATAAQTYGRAMPFLYTQNEPISARSWIPLQDTPTARLTYSATIRVPPGHLALMSAGDNPRHTNATGVYPFTMTQNIPAYLIALAVGRLEFHAFDERMGVYAEPELIDAAAWDLQYMPRMMAAAERILGPHPFPRHDVLLAPPTYIFGGMEHPMLNFLNPFGSINGNRSPAPEPRSLLAHELAHSWAGDATTLGSWSDIWLNEGITSYLTQRIIEEMGHGERSQYQWYADRANYAAYASSLQDPAPTALHRQLEHPEEGFSFTAYTKGALFLRTLEDLLGRTALDRFLRDYFRSFSFRWADDRNFIARLAASLGGSIDATLALQEWIYGPGLPSNVTAPTSSTMLERMKAQAEAFNAGAPFATLGPRAWTDTELGLFLGLIDPVKAGGRMAEIDSAIGLSFRNTPPLVWLGLAINTRYAPSDPAIERLLMRGGPNGTITTLYSWLIPADRARAERIFAAARERYHPFVVPQVERMFTQQASRAGAVSRRGGRRWPPPLSGPRRQLPRPLHL